MCNPSPTSGPSVSGVKRAPWNILSAALLLHTSMNSEHMGLYVLPLLSFSLDVGQDILCV